MLVVESSMPLQDLGGRDMATDVADQLLKTTIPSAHRHPRSYQWPDGITVPLTDVKRRRFRPRARANFADEEVERLLQADTQAMHVEYVLVDVPDEEDYQRELLDEHDAEFERELERELEGIEDQLMQDEDELVNVEDDEDDDVSMASSSSEGDQDAFAQDEEEDVRIMDQSHRESNRQEAADRIQERHRLLAEIADLEKQKEKCILDRDSATNEIVRRVMVKYATNLDEQIGQKKARLVELQHQRIQHQQHMLHGGDDEIVQEPPEDLVQGEEEDDDDDDEEESEVVVPQAPPPPPVETQARAMNWE
jgi:TATA-binding protein-associated factor Taf7